jgi:polysaccharide export outer membrane protein
MVPEFRWQGGHPSRRHSLIARYGALAMICWLAGAHGSAFAQTAATQAYRIAPGDKIGIVVFSQPDLSDEPTVDQNGNIRLPLVGDVRAATLTLTELEKNIEQALGQGYVKRPKVTAKITAFRPIHVFGLVRAPGVYPYQQGQSVFAAVMRAGGIGTTDQAGQGGDFFQADDRVRLLEINQAALLAKRARLLAYASRVARIDFPDTSDSPVDAARLADIRESEERAFAAERRAEELEAEALRQQVPRLEAEIASLKRQSDLELRQRDPGYNVGRLTSEIKRDETRIDLSSTRLKSEALKGELAVGELHFKIAELRNSYQRRAFAELRETEKELRELSVSLPSARRARAARTGQMDWLGAQEDEMPSISIIRATGAIPVKYAQALGFLLLPGDVVQVGSLLAPGSLAPSGKLSQITTRNR